MTPPGSCFLGQHGVPAGAVSSARGPGRGDTCEVERSGKRQAGLAGGDSPAAPCSCAHRAAAEQPRSPQGSRRAPLGCLSALPGSEPILAPLSHSFCYPAGFSHNCTSPSEKNRARKTMHKRNRVASEGKKLYLGRKFRCPTIFLSLPAQCYRVLRLRHAYTANIILMALFK